MPLNTRTLLVTLFTLLFLSLSSGSYADPPSRVARLSYLEGPVSFSPAGEPVWVHARINRPLIMGDRLWIDNQSRVELQLGTVSVRLHDHTLFRMINLNDQIAQFEILQGTISLHVRSIHPGQIYEIDTPNLAFKITQPGHYRFDVRHTSTTITVRSGKGIAYAKNVAYKIKGPAAYRFSGQNLYHQYVVLSSPDIFDRWSLERERRLLRSQSIRYVSPNMIGYEDLDRYGRWQVVREYGPVWIPTTVHSGWAPYREGHWSWISPWGWTWVDDQPWGFAPSHYGRWANYNSTWVWVPGRRTVQPSYAPALVVFIGGLQLQVSSGSGIAWFPLGPRDVYVPPYQVSKQYFNNINISNTTINQVQITNVYNNPTTQNTYTNRQTNAVTVIPTAAFVQSESAAKAAVPLPETASAAPVSATAAVTPGNASVAGAASSDATKPPESAVDKVPVVLTSPPAPTASFAEQETKLAENPGKPLDKTEMESLKPAEQIPVVEITAPPEAAIQEVKPTETMVDQVDSQPTEQHVIETPIVNHVTTEPVAQPPVEVDSGATEVKVEKDKVVTPPSELESTTTTVIHDDAAKIEADKAANAQTEIDKAEAQAEADRAAAEKAEADKANAQAQADRATAEKAAAEQAAAEQAAEANKASEMEADRAAKEQAQDAAARAQEEANRAAAAQEEAAHAAETARIEAQKAAEAKAAAEAEAAKAKAVHDDMQPLAQ